MKLVVIDSLGNVYKPKAHFQTFTGEKYDHGGHGYPSVLVVDGFKIKGLGQDDADVASELIQYGINESSMRGGTLPYEDPETGEVERWFMWEVEPTTQQEREAFNDQGYSHPYDPGFAKAREGHPPAALMEFSPPPIVLDDGSRARWGRGQWRGRAGKRLGTTFDLIKSGRTFKPVY